VRGCREAVIYGRHAISSTSQNAKPAPPGTRRDGVRCSSVTDFLQLTDTRYSHFFTAMRLKSSARSGSRSGSLSSVTARASHSELATRSGSRYAQ